MEIHVGKSNRPEIERDHLAPGGLPTLSLTDAMISEHMKLEVAPNEKMHVCLANELKWGLIRKRSCHDITVAARKKVFEARKQALLHSLVPD